MDFKHKVNNGSVFKNNKKEIATHPDVVGSGNVNGVEVWINGWYTGKEAPFMRFTFNAKEIVANDNAEQTVQPKDEKKSSIVVQYPQRKNQ